MKKEKSELEIELEQTIDFLRKRMSEYEFEYSKKLGEIKFLEEENKKLKETIERMKTDTMYDMKDINALYEENRKLKEENKMLIEDLSSDRELQQQIAQKQMDYYEENKKLKEELKNAECEFGFACEEIDYRKREAKRLGWKARD